MLNPSPAERLPSAIVTMAALPGQLLIYAALVIGILVKFPHLTALRRLLPGICRCFPYWDTPTRHSKHI